MSTESEDRRARLVFTGTILTAVLSLAGVLGSALLTSGAFIGEDAREVAGAEVPGEPGAVVDSSDSVAQIEPVPTATSESSGVESATATAAPTTKVESSMTVTTATSTLVESTAVAESTTSVTAATTRVPAAATSPSTVARSADVATDDLDMISVEMPDGWRVLDGEPLAGVGPALVIGESFNFFSNASSPGAYIVSSDLLTGRSIAEALSIVGRDYGSTCIQVGPPGESSDARFSRLALQAFAGCSSAGPAQILNSVQVLLIQEPTDSFSVLLVYQMGAVGAAADLAAHVADGGALRDQLLFSLEVG